MSKGGDKKKCSICRQIDHNKNNFPEKAVDEETAAEVQAEETAPPTEPADLVDSVDQPPPTQQTEGPLITQPPRNEVESQSTQAPQSMNESQAPTLSAPY